MPKPGYYYYLNRRALIGVGLLAPFMVGQLLTKFGPPADLTPLEMFQRYRVPGLLGIIALCLLLFVIRRLRMYFYEPRRADYGSREEFVAALERYAERRRYRHGWVYYRSNELWPD